MCRSAGGLRVAASDQPVPVTWGTLNAGIFKAHIHFLRALLYFTKYAEYCFRVSITGKKKVQ